MFKKYGAASGFKGKEEPKKDGDGKEKKQRKRNNWQRKNAFKTEKDYGWSDFANFSYDVVIKGSFGMKLASVTLVFLLILSQVFSVVYPLIFKHLINQMSCATSDGKSKVDGIEDNQECGSLSYRYGVIFFYVAVRFLNSVID